MSKEETSNNNYVVFLALMIWINSLLIKENSRIKKYKKLLLLEEEMTAGQKLKGG
jgi:hypothetical protein